VRAVRAVLGDAPPEVQTSPEFVVTRDGPVAREVASAPEMPTGAPKLRQSFTIAHPVGRVWAAFRDIEAVAACIPGVSLTAPPADGRVEGKVAVKLGPISAAFAGSGEVRLDEARRAGAISGQGRDSGSGSSVRGEVRFEVGSGAADGETRVDVTVVYVLTGALGQFARGGIVNDLAARLTADFADNLRASLEGRAPAAGGGEIAAGSLFFRAIWSYIKRMFGGA